MYFSCFFSAEDRSMMKDVVTLVRQGSDLRLNEKMLTIKMIMGAAGNVDAAREL
jgi:hypothetical protein